MICPICKQDSDPPALTFWQLFSLSPTKSSLCQSCSDQFEKISSLHCPRCYRPNRGNICSDCQRWQDMHIDISHSAIFTYNSAMQDFFRNYKFLGDYQLRTAFASFFSLPKGYTPVPIPISQKRYQERGFNQVTGLLEAGRVLYLDLLYKEDTPRQSSLTRKDRLTMKNPFKLLPDVTLPEKVCLIDDIYTTGTTLVHATNTLKSSGVREVKSFSLCR